MMNTNLNLNQSEDQLILYWVHLPEHTEEHLQGYIGVTKDFEKRMEGHRRKASNKYFQNAINKYGWDNLIKEVIVRGPEKDILELEQMFRPKERIGWNLAIGGGKPPVQAGEVQSKRRKAWIAANPEAEAERQRKSAETRRTDEFSRVRRNLSKAYWAANDAREAQAERRKAWIAENPKAHSEQQRKAAEACRTDEARKSKRERSKAWIADNPEAQAERQRKAAEAMRTDEYRKARSERTKAQFAVPGAREAQAERRNTWIAENPEAHAEQQRKAAEAMRTDEARMANSERTKAIPKKTCEHCGTQAQPGMFARWHGGRCKHNPNRDPSAERRELETKAKLKAIALARTKKTCVHCGGLFTPGNYGRYHGDKCKHKNKDTQL